MKIKFLNETYISKIPFDKMKDIRFLNEKNSDVNTKRRFSRLDYDKATSALLSDDEDNINAIILTSSGTWNGLKSLFINAFFVNSDILKNSSLSFKDSFTSLLLEVAKKTLASHYDTILLETEYSNNRILDLFKVLPILHSRILINYTINKDVLETNTKEAFEETLNNGFKIELSNINELKSYRSFMDSRPGWLTREDSISKDKGDTLVAVKTEFDTIAAICVFNSKTGVISRLATMPLSRNRGFASALLHYAVLNTQNEIISVVDINDKNDKAINFLKNKGFEIDIVKTEYTFSLKG